MKPADVLELCLLAALWGASFLFMRLGAGEFGPVALAGLRVLGATLFLLPLLAARRQLGVLRTHWRDIFLVGLANSALPFLAYSYAALAITAGLSSIFNATTPLWGALIAWLWLKDRLTPSRVLGLLIGFSGVLWLAWDKASFKPGADGTSTGWAIVACLGATLLYGWSASFTKKRLTGVAPLAVATGSQVSAALVLTLPMLWFWPTQAPSATAWLAVGLLALACTGVAYVLFFRLIARIGPSNTIAVTFLIPAFAVLWGWIFLAEGITTAMVIGCAVILVGTALTTGLVTLPLGRRKTATEA
ncbi:DMT family transporter [Methylibium petroleiphilum]|uniref:Putative transmembrane protein n=1 Tax=Methylibium petroleiphilum (strain ATCC BAA-1232 / LMG 22953 / PM1) TaxID=420662 RepID=A2SHR0_METPP|nr:DMT family transporter [Methylibium petroleiphilum]ABM95099.1 putative transmembrane protein [Methylibium petroleiphilum PM1]